MSQCIVGSRERWEFPPFCKGHRQSLCTALTTDKCMSLWLCNKTVKESTPDVRGNVAKRADVWCTTRTISPSINLSVNSTKHNIAHCQAMSAAYGEMINHYDDVTMSRIASLITSLTIVYSTVYSGADQRKHQSPASLAFVRGIHRGPVNSPHKWPVTRKLFPFDDVIMHVAEMYMSHLSIISESCHEANFVATCDTACYHNDNLLCRRWQLSWHQGTRYVAWRHQAIIWTSDDLSLL